jgi:nucleotide-binding universal stress UspA family protein
MAGIQNERELVVVGVDGSAQSVAALRWAARYATANGATVRAVLALHYPGTAGQPPAALQHDTEVMLGDVLDDAVAQAFPGDAADGVEKKLSSGHPAQVLLDESREADLLVVGSSGHGAFTGMLVGSVSIHCVTSARCPVTVVRGKRAEREAGHPATARSQTA